MKRGFISLVCTVACVFCLWALTVCGGGSGTASPVLDRIEVVQIPAKTFYFLDETFQREGMVVIAYYNDGSSEIVDDYTVTPSGILSESDTLVTISWGGKTTTVNITVRPFSLDRIEITAQPTKTEYLDTEPFSTSGMVIRAYFSDETWEVVTDYTVTPSGILSESDTLVTISWGGKTATVDITVTVSDPFFSNAFDTSYCTFYDKFDGDSLDLTKWAYQTGIGRNMNGWGNNEAQSYEMDNVSVGNGVLRIEARKLETPMVIPNPNTGHPPYSRSYTSGRIVTAQGHPIAHLPNTHSPYASDTPPGNSDTKFAQTFGRFEAKIRLTDTMPGLWPAFWMLSETDPYGVWPNSGEIDIMEIRSSETHRASGAVHWRPEKQTWNKFEMNYINFKNGEDYTDWQVYGVEWGPTGIRLMINGYTHRFIPMSWWGTNDHTYYRGFNKPADQLPPPEEITDMAPFDKPFFLILNLAVGGSFDSGAVPPDDKLPVAMEVDWVRAYTLDNHPWPDKGNW